MALTITIEGKGVIANCDSLTNDTGGSGTDDWLELGGGAISDEADAFLYGTTAIGNKYASKSGWTYYLLNTPLDFDTGGAEEGQFIYIWLNIAAPSAFDTLANEGFAIRIGNSTTVYDNFVIAGEDDANGWSGGWKLFVLDPTLTPTSSNGTVDVGAIDYIGIWIDTNSSVRADSIFIDQIAVGEGLRITGTWDSGTYGGAWEETVAYCNDYANRAWGMLQERDGIYYVFGKIYIGDSTQSANTLFEDSNKILQFGTTQYYNVSSTWVSTMPVTAAGIVIEDHASYTTTFKDGIIVGTTQGRSGSTIIGNADQEVSLDLYGGNNAASVTALYGTVLQGISGVINSGNDVDHKFLGTSFNQCAQFNPVGGCIIRNCIFAETKDTDSALLWNENIDIQESVFIANTTGAAIEHGSSTGSPYDYYDLSFSNNTYDGLNSSGTDITVNNNGTSDASLDEGANTITYLSSATLTITVKDEDGDPIETAYAYIDDNNNTPFIMNTTTNASGIATTGHTAGAVTGATWRVRKYGFKAYKATIDIPASGTVNLPVTLVADPQQT